MPRQSKCSYCHKEGHNITQCDSKEGNELFIRVRFRAHDTLRMFFENRNQTFHERAELFYKFLMRILCVHELKLILSKSQCRINGNKTQLAARFIYKYFILNYAAGPYRSHMEHNECLHLDTYARYWRLLSEGLLFEANQELDRYFGLIDQPETIHKFPINVVMKTVDLTEEEQPAQSFECAICMEEECPILDQVELGCGHSFCVSCVSTLLTNSQKNKKHPCCGLCRADFKNTQVHTQKIMEDYNTRFCFPRFARNIVR